MAFSGGQTTRFGPWGGPTRPAGDFSAKTGAALVTREPDATALAEIGKTGTDVLRPALFWSGDFPSGVVRFWTGFREIEWLGVTWNPSGTLLSFSSVEETLQQKAAGLGVVLSGVPTSMIALIENEEFQGRESRLILGFLDEDEDVVGGIDLHRGDMDVMETDEGRDTTTIRLTVEGPFIAMFRRDALRNTPEAHKQRFPGDTFFDFQAGLVDQEIIVE